MAIGTPTNRGTAGGSTSATTASFTPTANSILLALISTKATSAPSAPMISDSLGGTWTKITDVNGPATNPFIKGALYYQSIGASPAAMTVSANGGTTSTVIGVVEVTGAGTDFSNFNVATDAAGDPSCTVSTPGATSAVFGFAVGHLTNTFTQVGTYTELFDVAPAGGSNHRLEFAYDLSSPAATLSWTSTETNSAGVAFEVKEPAAGTQTLTPSLFTNSQTFYAPTVDATYSLTPALFSNAQTFFGPIVAPGAVALTPALVINSQTFPSATVAPGAVTLTPSLLTSAQSFFAPTVSQGGGSTQGLTPSLVTNSQTFYGPAVAGGAVTLAPPVVTNNNQVFAPTVSPGAAILSPPLVVSSGAVFAPAVTAANDIGPPLLQSGTQIFGPTVSLVVSSPVPAGRTTLAEPRMTTASGPHARTTYAPRKVA